MVLVENPSSIPLRISKWGGMLRVLVNEWVEKSHFWTSAGLSPLIHQIAIFIPRGF
jgi:hypothetical protein